MIPTTLAWDGLRATDEARQFLCMEKGDRIGHGLVLGVDPDEYYRNKQYSIYLRKQDYLDNFVWILYRSLELGIVVRDNDRAWMTNRALGVSINTDDLGVYDTSLENEYALMLGAICRSWHEAGNYNDDAVYEYLEYLRLNGINMTFGKE